MRRLMILALLLLGGCSGPTATNPASSTSPHISSSAGTTEAALLTSCPTAGTARAGVLTALRPGTDATLVYSDQPPANGGPVPTTLIRYDVATASKVTVLSAIMDEAQISPDGQWIGFTTLASGQPFIQFVRMDGTHLQTVYCGESNGNIRGLLWSPDQKWLLFAARGASGLPTIYMLDTTAGTLQTLLRTNSLTMDYAPFSWLDGSRLLVVGRSSGPGPGSDLRLLDMARGQNQQSSELTEVASSSAQCWDAHNDSTTLYTSECSGAFSDTGGSVWRGPSVVAAQPATGGQKRNIFTSPTLAVIQVSPTSGSQLLLSVGNQDPTRSTAGAMNGLWKVNLDGSGLTQLVSTPEKQGQLNLFSQAAWANVSRDGSLYAFEISSLVKVPAYSVVFGPLTGTQPTTIAARADGGQLLVVGWTTT